MINLSYNIIIDTFDILGNTINKNLIIEEYFNEYSNHNLSDMFKNEFNNDPRVFK